MLPLHCIDSSNTPLKTWRWPSERAETCCIQPKYVKRLLQILQLCFDLPYLLSLCILNTTGMSQLKTKLKTPMWLLTEYSTARVRPSFRCHIIGIQGLVFPTNFLLTECASLQRMCPTREVQMATALRYATITLACRPRRVF
jgi:hypothetical protein